MLNTLLTVGLLPTDAYSKGTARRSQLKGISPRKGTGKKKKKKEKDKEDRAQGVRGKPCAVLGVKPCAWSETRAGGRPPRAGSCPTASAARVPPPPPPPRGLRDSSRPLKFPPLSPLPFKSSSFSDRSPGAGGAAEAGRGGRASGPPPSCPRRCRPCPRVRQRAQTALSRLAGRGD